MPELSLHNIDKITADIRRQEIAFSHLFDDLVDHVCCDVEYEMQNGLSFTEAYRRVKENIGTRGLKKIQEETLYAVDTKYRRMKNTMKITGVTGTVMLGFAAMFKIMHWPLAGVLLTLGALVLSFFFFPSALIVLWKETKSGKRIILFISAFIGGVAFILGILFKVQHWPGASAVISLFIIFTAFLFIPNLLASKLRDEDDSRKKIIYVVGAAGFFLYVISFWFKIMHWPYAGLLLIISYVTLFCIALPWYTWHEWKNEPRVTARFIFMIVGPLLFILPSALVNLNLDRSFEERFFYHQQQQDALVRFQEKINAEFVSNCTDSSCYPAVEKIHGETDKVIGLINRLEWKIVQAAEGAPGKPADMGISEGSYDNDIPFTSLTNPFKTGISAEYLRYGSSSRNELEEGLSVLGKTISGYLGDEWSGKYRELLSTSSVLPDREASKNYLELMSVMPCIHGLTIMKNRILSLETDAIGQIAGNNL